MPKRELSCLPDLAAAVLSAALCCAAGPARADAGAVAALSQAQSATARDSAGVRIVENVRATWPRGSEWRVEARPSVTIGRADGAAHDVLSSVSGAVRLADGTIAVGDGGAHSIRLYDAHGRHLISFGGAGAGPGEFGVLGPIGRLRGDSIGVWDPVRKRITVFSTTGAARTGPGAHVSGVIVPAVGWLEDGSVVVNSTLTVEQALSAPQGRTRNPKPFILVQPDGRTTTLLVMPGHEIVVQRSTRSYVPQPVVFGRNSYMAVSADAFVTGDSDTFELRRSSRDGRLTLIIRNGGGARPVTAEELSAARSEAAARWDRMSALAGAALRGNSGVRTLNAEDPPHRTTHPHFDALMLDATGHIWARQSSAGAGPRSWLVFDPDGIWLGAVTVPADLRVTDIGRDYVLGVHRDELDVESVRLYRLDRAR